MSKQTGDSRPEQRPPRRRDADATRTLLLRAAQRRFTVLGYERTTTRDIAAEAGVNVSLIGRYFGSKQSLYTEVLDKSGQLFAGTDAASSETDDSDVPDLLEMIIAGLRADAWPEYGNEHPSMLLVRHAGVDPTAQDLRRQAMLTSISVTERLLVALGDDEPDDRRLRAELLTSTFIGLAVMRSLLADDAPSAQSEAALHEELLRLARAACKTTCDRETTD